MKESSIYLNGKHFKCASSMLDAFTPGVFQGKGVFETMLAVGHKIFDVEEHLKRLKSSMPQATISSAIVRRVVEANGFELSRVRVMVWKEKRVLHQLVMALKHQPAKKDVYKACFVKTNRKANSRLSSIKSLDYGLFAQAYAQACAQGFDEALLLNEKGDVFEASRANVFVMYQGVLFTPPLSSGCLDGIIRRRVMAKARRMGIPVCERTLSPSFVSSAADVFLTNSLIGIKPVKISSIVLPR